MNYVKGSIFNYLFNLNGLCSALQKQLTKGIGLSSSELKSILAVYPGKEISCNEFSERTGLSVSRASRVIEKMVKNGLLQRDCDSSDRRKCVVSVSLQGEKIKKKLTRKINMLESKISGKLSEEENKTIISGLDLMVSRLNNFLNEGY